MKNKILPLIDRINNAIEGYKNVKKRDRRLSLHDQCKYEEYREIKKALIQAEANKKLLNLIKKKKVNIGNIFFAYLYDSTPEYYNTFLQKRYWLTKEEFDLIKKFLK